MAKNAKEYYLPKTSPALIDVTEFNFIIINGSGNPNSSEFADRVAALYALSYAINMSPKKGINPVGCFEYTVFPLEGIWDINEEAKLVSSWTKDQLAYKLMIRQAYFVTTELFNQIRDILCAKDTNSLLMYIELIKLTADMVVQCIHIGSYDDEAATFAEMEQFCLDNDLQRKNKTHREIYLSDARKVAPEKLQTVLRFEVLK